jgi:hypothetical protein
MAAVASSEVGEVEADKYYYVHGARSVIRQVGTSSSRKLPQMGHQMWEWESPKTERIQTTLTKAEVQIYRPVLARGPDGDPESDAVQANPQRSSSFQCSKSRVPWKAMGH